MKMEERRITFDEFAGDVAGVVNHVISEDAEVIVETENGASVVIVPHVTVRRKSEEDLAAFRAAAGSWADMDTDAFLEAIYTSRTSSRPPVDL